MFARFSKLGKLCKDYCSFQNVTSVLGIATTGTIALVGGLKTSEFASYAAQTIQDYTGFLKTPFDQISFAAREFSYPITVTLPEIFTFPTPPSIPPIPFPFASDASVSAYQISVDLFTRAINVIPLPCVARVVERGIELIPISGNTYELIISGTTPPFTVADVTNYVFGISATQSVQETLAQIPEIAATIISGVTKFGGSTLTIAAGGLFLSLTAAYIMNNRLRAEFIKNKRGADDLDPTNTVTARQLEEGLATTTTITHRRTRSLTQ